jgi:hypothetical protein
MGLKLEREEPATHQEQHTECYPDNWLPFHLFSALETQWNIGPRFVIGLRYESIGSVLEEFEIEQKRQPDMRRCLRVMEKAALKVINNG